MDTIDSEELTQGHKIKAYGYLITTFILWGSLYVVSKYTLGKLPTFTISFLRFVIAFVALTAMGKREKVRTKIERKDYPYLLLIGIGGYFIAVGAQLLGTKYASASLASLINALNPLTMTLFATLILHEKLTKFKIAGLAIALAGVYVILGGGINGNVLGICMSLFSVVVWSIISVFMRKITQKYDSLQITRYGIGIAAICYFPLCASEFCSGKSIHFDASCIAALLYMGIICTGFAYHLWNASLSTLEASTCSAFYPVQPLVSAVLGIVVLHEIVAPSFWIGAILIVAGILVNLSKHTHNNN